ncbi:hypothetical protein D3C81_1551170 [compost metagenome]
MPGAFGHAPVTAVGADRRRSGPLRGIASGAAAGAWRKPGGGVPPGRRPGRPRCYPLRAAVPGVAGRHGRVRQGQRLLAAHPGHRADRDAGTCTGCADQRLVDVPGDRLPVLGAQRLLPVWRCHRFSRPAAGQHGHGPCRAGGGAPAPAGLRCASVCRRRRAALVAPTVAARGAYPLLR